MASNGALLGFSGAGQPIRAALLPGQPARQGRESSLGVRRDGATGFLRREQIRLALRMALQFRARFEPDLDRFGTDTNRFCRGMLAACSSPPGTEHHCAVAHDAMRGRVVRRPDPPTVRECLPLGAK